MKFAFFLILSIILIFNNVVKSQSSSYKPILLMHGFALSDSCGSYHDWDHYIEFIKQYNPNQIAIPLNVDNNFKSSKSMFKQINDIHLLIESITQNNTDFENGYHIIAHSQGALSMRSVVQMFGLNVDNFISLAGVQNGIYGVGPFTNNYWFGNLTNKEITNILYTSALQKSFSVANWWSDPLDYERYLEDNMFLPTINQELQELTPEYKSNFINSISGSFNAFGSPDDGIVVPWVSELFGFYDENMNIIQMNETKSYQSDSYGLKTLHLNGKLNLNIVDGVKHADWLSREDLFVQYVLPLISK